MPLLKPHTSRTLAKPALALTLALALSNAPAAQATDFSEMTAEQKEAFGAQVRSYLLENPEVIFEAAAVYEQRQQAAQAADDRTLVEVNAADIYDDGFSWVGGNPEGDVTLVEFVDYRCAYCRKAHEDVSKLLQADGNIRYIVKELPILGDDSNVSSRFAVAVRQVAGDEAYGRAFDLLLTYTGPLTPAALHRLAETLEVDGEAVLAQMESDDVSHVINETRALAKRLRISGTPTFVLAGDMHRGYVPGKIMETLIAQHRQTR